MNQQEREYLSALIDDECTDKHKSTIRMLLKDKDARGIFKRYHLVGDAMRGNLPEQIVDITQQIREKIATQDLPIAEPQTYTIKTAGIYAMAASLMIVAVIFFSGQQSHQSANIAPQSANIAYQSANIAYQSANIAPQSANIAHQSANIAHSAPSDSAPSELTENMLYNYLLSHNGHRINTGVIGMSPNIRVVIDDMDVAQ